MKMEKLNAWIGFSGNVAILLGLIALAVEISDNTAAVRAQELGALQEQTQERRLALLSKDLRELYIKSLYSPAELTLDELLAINTILTYRVTVLNRYYRAYSDGIIQQEDWESVLLEVPIFLGSSFGRLFWDEIKADYPHEPDFVDDMTRALSSSAVIPDDEYFINLQERVRALIP
jgi:hypothetical protein